MTLPDRLSIDRESPFHDRDLLLAGVGIVFDGKERTNVAEYCVSQGWVRVIAGNARGRDGKPLTFKLWGKVEPYQKARQLEPSSV